ncbi:hypothetical protein [Amycolatopsis viridis]|uniref:MarR family transcriptional regulator n=1 Tax=Amycolatopsis viridis TaxID=185678 RepID=A0ABX0SX30_9PSEU|nr:hypothetical protein [Amycolatopsis viridis]NIH79895.1 hypothetical protein [Amycolatopsis viridis]
MDPLDRPIGFWLRHLHTLLETGLDELLAGHGLTRRHWQALNAPRYGADVLEVFEGAGQARADLVARGWTTPDGALTEAGRAAHTEIAEHVQRFRARTLEGLTDQQYADTVRTLAAMAGNLEAAH